MATVYQLHESDTVIEIEDGGARSFCPVGSAGYRRYQAWVAAGNTPEPAEPPPVVYSGSHQLSARLRTTNATPAELFRATLAPLTAYAALLDLLAVDAGNGALRVIRASIVAKRLNNGAILVGTPVVIANHQDTVTSSWGISATVDGSDFVITVTGAAGRDIDWLLGGTFESFTPGG